MELQVIGNKCERNKCESKSEIYKEKQRRTLEKLIMSNRLNCYTKMIWKCKSESKSGGSGFEIK